MVDHGYGASPESCGFFPCFPQTVPHIHDFGLTPAASGLQYTDLLETEGLLFILEF
jgi:hypothetical protein